MAASITATARATSLALFNHSQIRFQIPFSFSLSNSQISHCPIYRSAWQHNPGVRILGSPHASVSGLGSQGTFDPELRSVLQLATKSELFELERILYGPSYFSPLLKSVTGNRGDVDYVMIEVDPDEREDFITSLESRFLYLAADARSTLRGWRPSYRSVLLDVRRELKIPCSTKLSTEDLEVEIFLHLLQEYPSEESFVSRESLKLSDGCGGLELGLDQWKVQAVAALRVGVAELRSMVLKGGGIFTLAKVYKMIAGRLSGEMLMEAANYQIKKEVIKKGGHLAAMNPESRAALLAAKQGVAGAASRYLGLRSMVSLLGPMLWGTFLADVVIQMLGTDYARILRAIYAFAQVGSGRTEKLDLMVTDGQGLQSLSLCCKTYGSPVHIIYHLMSTENMEQCGPDVLNRVHMDNGMFELKSTNVGWSPLWSKRSKHRLDA